MKIRKIIEMQKLVDRGVVMPAWYGIAWFDYENDLRVCYPVPLNLIVGYARALMIWMRYGYRSAGMNTLDIYAQGVEEGKRRVYARISEAMSRAAKRFEHDAHD